GKVPTNSTGTVTLTWNNLNGTGANITDGNSYARIRLTTDNLAVATATTTRDLASVGSATNGEVEDYPIAIAFKANSDLSPNFCQASSSARNLLFILDDSSSVNATEIQQQRDAIMATLNDFVAKNLTGKAAIVAFDSVGNTVINYTDITAANLSTFKTALDTNYGDEVQGTHWEKGFQAGIDLPGGTQPNVVFFFTDGANNSGNNPDGKAAQFKAAGAHIYGIGIELTVDNGFKGITDGSNTIIYDGSNIQEADYLDIDSYNTLQNQFTNAFLANLCPADFGDAPDTYGTDNIANSITNPLGANHDIVSELFIGAKAPDTDANGFVDGIDNNSGNAIDDDAPIGTGSGNGDDEGNFTFPTLNAGKKSYTIPTSSIIVTNATEQIATLHAWIDFNKNGTFEPTEYAGSIVGTGSSNPQTNLTWTGVSVGTVGNTYARFRLTSDDNINNSTPGGNANDGEVEDYQVAIAQASDPNLLLVKRITAINPGQPGEMQFNNFIDDPGTTDDTNPNWPNINNYLQGEISVPQVKPGDEVEYTIYFLSNGDIAAKDVKICDAIPDNMTFNKHSYGTEVGISLALDPTNLPNNTNKDLSNLIGDDEGSFYAPGTNPPLNLCKKHDPNDTDNLVPHNLISVDGSNNLSGTVLIHLINPLPPATASGTPPNSYGFVRFRAKVK
ncbi:MAG: GEVED domain-containing protein, partial [Waterburya sp.]